MNAVLRFRQAIADRAGLWFDDGKLPFLAAILDDASQLHVGGVASYLAAFESGETELRRLAPQLTVGETYFFRHIEQFRALAEVALPDRLDAPRSGPLRILSAGCASGEEAYSIAMIAREVAPARLSDIEIVGIDLNHSALKKAERARYGRWALRETDDATRKRLFRKVGEEFEVDRSSLPRVRFELGNLARPETWPWQTFDIVFCRNMLMYFTPDVFSQVVASLASHLSKGGYLFLGHAETLRGTRHDLALRNSHGTFYYRNESARAPGDASAQSLHGSSKGEERETWFDAVGRASARIVALSEVKEQHANVSPVPWSASVLKMIEAERFADALAEVAKAPVHADLATRGVFSAMLHLQMDHLDAAEQQCQALAADFPRDPRAFFLLGLIQERRELSAAATALHQRAIDLAPTFAMPHLHLARLARRRGDLGTATHHFRQAVGWLPAEDAEWILLFGGGFGRSALERMCRAELEALAGEPGAAP